MQKAVGSIILTICIALLVLSTLGSWEEQICARISGQEMVQAENVHNVTMSAIDLGTAALGDIPQSMNAKAAQLGCQHTHFVTPNGLDDQAHYTTAQDLCRIAAYAIQNQDFLDIIQIKSYSFQDISGSRQYTVNNHDAFLGQYTGAIGIKTGFTGNAGYCFCGGVRKNGITLVSSVLAFGWPPHKTYKWQDTRSLMDYGFASYQKVNIPFCTTTLSCPVSQGKTSYISLQRQDTDPLEALLNQQDIITITYDMPESVKAPIRQGDIIGYEKYAVNGTIIRRIPLTAYHKIKKVSWSDYWNQLLSIVLC